MSEVPSWHSLGERLATQAQPASAVCRCPGQRGPSHAWDRFAGERREGGQENARGALYGEGEHPDECHGHPKDGADASSEHAHAAWPRLAGVRVHVEAAGSTQRKPAFPVELSGVLAWRAATR